MAGLLDTIFASNAEDPRYAANMGLFTGMMRGDMAGGLLQGSKDAQAMKQAQADNAYKQLMGQNLQSEMAQRQLKMQQDQAALERQRQIQAAMPSLFGMQGQPQGVPQGMPQRAPMGGQPMEQPMEQAPMEAPQQAPQQVAGGFDARRAALLGMDPDLIQKYVGLQNAGRQEVARTVNVPGPNGEKMVLQIDKFGQPVGNPMSEFEAAQMVNLGDRQAAIIPRAGMQPLPMGMSPESKASNALGWANHGLTKRGQDMTDARSREANAAGKAPAGYRLAANGQGLEFIPGGPADPAAARRAAPTEDERKAAGWLSQATKGFADMSQAIKDEPKANRPGYVEANPFLPEALKNMTRSDARQRFNQGASALSEAVLRAATGAGVNKDEAMQKVAELTPQWGDTQGNIDQKQASAKNYLESLAVRSGRANPQGVGGQPTMRFNPATGKVEMVGQ